jgi:hypothetical protein
MPVAYYVGQEVETDITLLDASSAPITGATFVETALDPALTSFPTSISEVAPGIYRITFTPSTSGSYYLQEQYIGPPIQTFAQTFDVDQAATQSGPVAIIGGLSLTRRTLRRRIAGRMGDLVMMTATAASASTSTFVDALTVNIIAENLDGRMIVVGTGANAGHVARIQSKDNATSTITFTPPATTTFAQGDEIEVLNAHSRGFLVDEYNRAINDAIDDAWPRFKLDYTYALPSDFDYTNPSITVPDEMAYVYEVQWQNSDDNWIALRKGKWYGWRANPALGTITVLSDPAPMINGRAVRLFGYGRHPELSADADLCAVPAEWLVARACYHLSLGGIDKENAKANAVLTFAREADMLFRRIVTPPHPSMERVH